MNQKKQIGQYSLFYLTIIFFILSISVKAQLPLNKEMQQICFLHAEKLQ
jgi:hypothetical protein